MSFEPRIFLSWAILTLVAGPTLLNAEYVEIEVAVKSDLIDATRKDVIRNIETSLRQSIAYVQQVKNKDAPATYHLKVNYAGAGRVGSVRKITQRGTVIDRQTGGKLGTGSEYSYVADADHTAVYEFVLSKKTDDGLAQVQSWTVRRPTASKQLYLGDEIVVDKDRDRGEGVRGFKAKADEAYGRWIAEQAALKAGEVENHWYKITDVKSKTKDGSTLVVSAKVTNQTPHAVKNVKVKLATTARYTTRQSFADGRRPIDSAGDAELGKSEADSGPLAPGESAVVSAEIEIKGVPKRGASTVTGLQLSGGRENVDKLTIITDPVIGHRGEVLAVTAE